jgi:4-aminobutyrate aminotransferase-like enzyme
VPAPDVYRGEHRGNDAGTKYADYVRRVCEAQPQRVGAFFIESGMSVAGVIIPPEGYLQQCYAAVRGAGGVCVADEVQTGLGRVGTHWWAFEEHGVVPDVVTVGKPFGNGMPLAAVVCTADVAASFATGPEYFNTFGGNPVCCAAGLAVIDEIERLSLRRRALEVGGYLKAMAEALAQTPAGKLIGQVRGRGLFIGIEFSRPGPDRPPAAIEASWICSRLKVRSIYAHTTEWG